MVDIKRLSNGTSSELIAKKLDELDSNKDGKIEASIWNEFVKDKGGKEVKEFISIEDAMRSICTYAVRESKEKGNANDLAAKWLEDVTEKVAAKQNAKTAKPAEGTEQKEQADVAKETKTTEQTEQTSVAGQAEQTSATKEAEQAEAAKQTEQASAANQTDATEEAEQPEPTEKTEQDRINKDYEKVRVSVPKSAVPITKFKGRKEKLAKIQETFDNATKFMAEIANMDPKPKVTDFKTDDYKWKEIKFSDGRWMTVRLDPETNEIVNIKINYDTTRIDPKGHNIDPVDVEFSANQAEYNLDGKSGSIKKGYDFEQLKELAKKIIGE